MAGDGWRWLSVVVSGWQLWLDSLRRREWQGHGWLAGLVGGVAAAKLARYFCLVLQCGTNASTAWLLNYPLSLLRGDSDGCETLY